MWVNHTLLIFLFRYTTYGKVKSADRSVQQEQQHRKVLKVSKYWKYPLSSAYAAQCGYKHMYAAHHELCCSYFHLVCHTTFHLLSEWWSGSTGSTCPIHYTGTHVSQAAQYRQPCVNSYWLCQWERAIFDPTESTPFNRSPKTKKTLLLLITSATPMAVPNLVQIHPQWASGSISPVADGVPVCKKMCAKFLFTFWHNRKEA